MAMLMNDQLSMFPPTTSEATASAISSPVSAAGASPCAAPDGMTLDLFGQAVAPASRSAPRAKARRPMTSATSGPTGSGLSGLYDRQLSFSNRLKQRLDGVGSTLFTLTWQRKATPLGLPYFQLVASGRPISGSDYGAWPTPAANSFEAEAEVTETRRAKYREKYGNNGFGLTTAQAAQLASWPTPAAQEPGGTPEQHLARKRAAKDRGAQMGTEAVTHLSLMAHLASWPTPMAGTPAQNGYNEAGNNDSSRKPVELCSWATPRVTSNGGHGSPKRADDGRARLEDQVHGLTSSGSPAQTEKRGQLNPAFSLWLQGYPTEWLNCAPQGIRSSRRSRPSS
jgi:hypothetical protein